MNMISWIPFVQTVKQYVPNEILEFKSKDRTEIVSLKSLIDKYVPEFNDNASSLVPPFLFSGHLQTIFASMSTFENRHPVFYRRWMLMYPDGGAGALDICVSREVFFNTKNDYVPESQTRTLLPGYTYFRPQDKPSSDDYKPMLIILHGLTGGSNESYVRSLVQTITESYGFEACVLNSRGCCQSTITTPSLYCGLWTDDIRHCVKELRSMFPNRKFFLCGVSLGASMAANYLGQEGTTSDIEMAAVLGNPWDLTASSYHLERTMIGKYAYTPALAKSLVSLTKTHIETLKNDPNMAKLYAEHLDTINTVEQFDNYFTSRMFGFNTSFEYYRHGTSSNRLYKVRTPLLILNSLDDPIVGSESLPYREVECNPYTTMIATTRGGHIGWFDLRLNRWYVEPLCKLLNQFYLQVSMKDLKPDLSSVSLPKENKFDVDRLIK